jgi:hypothetical protein
LGRGEETADLPGIAVGRGFQTKKKGGREIKPHKARIKNTNK